MALGITLQGRAKQLVRRAARKSHDSGYPCAVWKLSKRQNSSQVASALEVAMATGRLVADLVGVPPCVASPTGTDDVYTIQLVRWTPLKRAA